MVLSKDCPTPISRANIQPVHSGSTPPLGKIPKHQQDYQLVNIHGPILPQVGTPIADPWGISLELSTSPTPEGLPRVHPANQFILNVLRHAMGSVCSPEFMCENLIHKITCQ